ISPWFPLVPQGEHSRAPGPSAFPLPVPDHLSFSSSLAEASGVKEFVADPAALATILSGCLGLRISGPQIPHPPTWTLPGLPASPGWRNQNPMTRPYVHRG
ncbi:hypothetical protein MC885_021896, partial [Smutsia gigantea]